MNHDEPGNRSNTTDLSMFKTSPSIAAIFHCQLPGRTDILQRLCICSGILHAHIHVDHTSSVLKLANKQRCFWIVMQCLFSGYFLTLPAWSCMKQILQVSWSWNCKWFIISTANIHATNNEGVAQYCWVDDLIPRCESAIHNPIN